MRIYLDNAATSWPKPEAVYRAVDEYQRQCGAPGGRSSYADAVHVSQAIEATRHGVARLIGASSASRVVFTLGGTDSLNLAIHGLLRPGDRVVTSVAEHNSVLRPLREAESTRQVAVTRLGCDARGVIDPDEIRRVLRANAASGANTRLVVLTHASNVTGALQPIAEVGQIAHEYGASFLVDAAQTLGDIPISVDALHIDLLAAPAHKGLLAPLGLGVLYMREGLEREIHSLRQGGTGTQSEDDRQPESMPGKFESGSPNVPAILGLGAALEYLQQAGLAALRARTVELTSQLLAELKDLPGVTLYGPPHAADRVGLVSLNMEGYDPQELAATLDAAYGVQVRAGLHCAPLMHRSLGTLDRGGTVRLSLGVFTTPDDIAAAVSAVREIAAETSTL